MNEIYSTLLHSNTFNFLILVLFFALILWKMDIKSTFENLRESIKSVVEKSEQEKQLALNELKHTEEELKNLPKELENIIQTAKDSAENISVNIQKDAQAELEKIEYSTESAINFETKRFQELLTNMTSNASVELAKNNAIRELNAKKELHQKYINEAIDELDKVVF